MMGFVQQISHLFESDVFMNGGYDIQQTPRNRRTPQQIVVVEFMRREVGLCLQGTPGERLGQKLGQSVERKRGK